MLTNRKDNSEIRTSALSTVFRGDEVVDVIIAGLWMFQVPGHDDFADLSWRDVKIDGDYFTDALTWGSLVVDDVSALGEVELPTDFEKRIGSGLGEAARVDSHVYCTLYAFGICAVQLSIESDLQLSRDAVRSIGRFLDSISGELGNLAGIKLGIKNPNSLTRVWNRYVFGTVADSVQARSIGDVVAKVTEVAPPIADGEVFQSVVGNKFSVLNTNEQRHFDECLELFTRASVYAAGFYRYERLMIKELLRLAVNDRKGGRAPSETLSVHNGARILRALSTHQTLATPVNRRGIQRALWTLWNMDELVGSVSELTEKVSALLGSRRDERRNLLTSRLNWIVLGAAVLQVVIAVISFAK